MNSSKLDSFLREHTFYEKFLLSKVNFNDTNSLRDFIKNTSFDENIMRKLLIFDAESVETFLSNPTRPLNNKTILNMTDDITFVCHPRFVETPEHHHNYVEMIYVYSGELHQIVNGEKISMKKGEVCILDTNVLHSIDKTSENDIIINCIMSKKYLDDILISRLSQNDLLSSFFIHAIYQSEDYNDYILFKSSESKEVPKLMQTILCEYFDKGLCSNEIINSYMVIILSELLRIIEKQTNSENYALLKNTKITDIILYIQNNCEAATLASVAEHFHFHPNYLNSVIKKFKGNNFTFILQEAKLKKACFLLKNSDLPVVEIAKNIGYENISFFYKIFKKVYGCTPAEYKKINLPYKK